jgi:MoaA/NifB/PqqE/SkfB family radical SAM enzyme
MKHFFFELRYVLSYRFLTEKTPLICGLVMNNSCNLRCLHCRITERPDQRLSFEDSKTLIDSFYIKGGRTIYFEGGEPFLWQDQEYKLENVVRYAKQRGYPATIIYTNGTFPLETSADTVFISMDGLKETNDLVRGNVFEKIMQNIYTSDTDKSFISSSKRKKC